MSTLQSILRELRAIEVALPDEALSQAEWHVDPAAGDDGADGSAASPIRTLAELDLRLGAQQQLSPPGGAVDVYLAGDVPPGDPLTLRGALLRGTGSLRVHGRRTVARTGVVASVQAASPAAGTGWTVADPAVASWAAEVGRLVTVTASAVPGNVGTVFLVEKDLGGGAARVTTPTRSMAASPGGLQAGDEYAVLSLSALTVGSAVVAGSAPGASGAYLQVDGCALAASPQGPGIVQLRGEGCRLALVECAAAGVLAPAGDPSFANQVVQCWAAAGMSLSGTWSVAAGAVRGFLVLQGGSFLQTRLDAVVSRGQVQVGAGAKLHCDGLAVFDAVGSAGLSLTHNAAAYLETQDSLWGGGGGGWGVLFSGGSTLARRLVGGAPVRVHLTGALGDLAFAGGRSSEHAFDPVLPGYVAARPLSWAAVDAPVAAGGFGGSVVSPVTGDKVVATG